MKEHDWSRRVPVYETIDMVVCRGCGATMVALDEDGNLDLDCERSQLPLDCEQAVPFVVHEDYDEWDQGPWDEDEKPEWGIWGTAFHRQAGKHFPCALWRFGSSNEAWLLSEEEHPTYMAAWRRCLELNRQHTAAQLPITSSSA